MIKLIPVTNLRHQYDFVTSTTLFLINIREWSSIYKLSALTREERKQLKSQMMKQYGWIIQSMDDCREMDKIQFGVARVDHTYGEIKSLMVNWLHMLQHASLGYDRWVPKTIYYRIKYWQQRKRNIDISLG